MHLFPAKSLAEIIVAKISALNFSTNTAKHVTVKIHTFIPTLEWFLWTNVGVQHSTSYILIVVCTSFTKSLVSLWIVVFSDALYKLKTWNIWAIIIHRNLITGYKFGINVKTQYIFKTTKPNQVGLNKAYTTFVLYVILTLLQNIVLCYCTLDSLIRNVKQYCNVKFSGAQFLV